MDGIIDIDITEREFATTTGLGSMQAGVHRGVGQADDGAVTRCTVAAAEARTAERKASPDREPVPPEFPRITPHDLRHTAASLAISAGATSRRCRRCSDTSPQR